MQNFIYPHNLFCSLFLPLSPYIPFSAIPPPSLVSHGWNILLFLFPPDTHIHAFLKSCVSMGSYVITSYNTKILHCTLFKSITRLGFWHNKGTWDYTLQKSHALLLLLTLRGPWTSHYHTFSTTAKVLKRQFCSWLEAPSFRLLALQPPETLSFSALLWVEQETFLQYRTAEKTM